jgi:glutathione S-transferase
MLVDGDIALTESRAIMQYLASTKPESGLLPQDNKERIDVTRWQFWDASHFSPCLGTIAFEKLMKPMMRPSTRGSTGSSSSTAGRRAPDPSRVGERDPDVARVAALRLDDEARG